MVAHDPYMINRRASRAVALAEQYTPAERRELLDMLGLVDAAGALTPDDLHEYEDLGIKLGSNRQSRRGAFERMYDGPDRPETYSSPPALRNFLANFTAEERAKQITAPRRPRPTPPPRPLAPCGTISAYNRHKRRRETICDACRLVYNAWQRERASAKRRERGAATRRDRALCGTASGRKAHQRRGEPVCEACMEAQRAEGRARYRRKQQRQAAALEQAS